jgi:hypothetical protein
MTAVPRNARRIEIEGREFLWWLYEEWEEPGPVTLAVSSADKRLLVRYQINQPDDGRYLSVVGREFAGLPERWSGWTRVKCPVLVRRDAVKPRDVRRLIEWCLHPKSELIQVDWSGRELPPDHMAMQQARPAGATPEAAQNGATPRSSRRA